MGRTQAKPRTSSSLLDALFPRQRVLAELFGTPERRFYANAVIALAQSGSGAVQRELATLSEAGLLTVSKQGNQKHFQANAAAPVFTELRGLVPKTMGPWPMYCAWHWHRWRRKSRLLLFMARWPESKTPPTATATATLT